MTDQPPSTELPEPRERLGALRIILVLIGVIAVLFSGGCSLMSLSDGTGYWEFVLMFGGPPFALGLLVIWMALRLGRGRVPPPPMDNEETP